MSLVHGFVAALLACDQPKPKKLKRVKVYWYVRVPILVKLFPGLEWRISKGKYVYKRM